MRNLHSKVSIFLIFIGSCIEPFSPEINSYEELLVIDSMITNLPSSHFVRLSRTIPLYSSQEGNGTNIINAETGATIVISNSLGNRFVAKENIDGIYQFDFNPVIGETYILTITTNEDKVYISDPVVMKETPPIDNLYFERASVPSEEQEGLDDGYQIYVDTGTGGSESGFYKFEWEETWQITTPYHSFFDYDLQKDSIFERTNNLSDCWFQSSSTNLNLKSTESLSSDKVDNHPIRFISFKESFLRERYSLLVKQYALSRDSYYFWVNLEETSELNGTLYDKQPSQIVGNIHNTNDPSEPVLGYFDMATVTTKRVFIDKFDLPNGVIIPSLFKDCLLGADTVVSPFQISNLIRHGYLISREILGSGFEMVVKNCIDCRSKGSNVEPDFWTQ